MLQSAKMLFVDDTQFEQLLDDAIDSLPIEFRQKLKNVAVRYQNNPSREQLKRAKVTHGLLLGLYEGMPYAKGGYYRLKLPDTITLFKNPLLMVSRTSREFQMRVRDTLIHEIAHHFGLSENEVRSAELARRKRLKQV